VEAGEGVEGAHGLPSWCGALERGVPEDWWNGCGVIRQRRSRFPEGMTERKARATATAEARATARAEARATARAKARAGLWLIPPVREVRVRMGHPELWRESCYARSGYMRGARLAMDFGGLAGD
jgi:hypothetical protein